MPVDTGPIRQKPCVRVLLYGSGLVELLGHEVEAPSGVMGTSEPFLLYLLNSAQEFIWAAIITVIFSMFAGYAFARFNFRGKTVMMSTLFISLMFPDPILLTPIADIFKWTG